MLFATYVPFQSLLIFMYMLRMCIQHRKVELEKQKQFESVLLAGVSEEKKEAMWTNAQQQAVSYA